MRNLVVGDVHAVPEELDDCRALVKLVADTAHRLRVDNITWMGDQHNAHDTMSTRVLAFWREAFDLLRNYPQVAIVGNHDQATPRDRFPHAMLAYKDMRNLQIVDAPMWVPSPDGKTGFCAMPYFHDPEEFLREATRLKEQNPGCETLFCHQTFVGADGGFYAKDECRAAAVPFKAVFSGHIHSPQVVDKKAVYVGAPRWRTKDDAGKDRYLLLLEHGAPDTRPRLVEKVPTDAACRRLYVFQDRPDAPAPLDSIPPEKRHLAKIRVDVHGPAAHVRERELALRAAGARTRAVVERARRARVTETEGVDRAFAKFVDAFVPPAGTPPARLRAMLEERLGH